ncbi:MAG: hypothetical protein IE916_00400 [Epsilonproteobacteria bacterium]|nr:hypothetical protein [Campylobacterota bacterium]
MLDEYKDRNLSQDEHIFASEIFLKRFFENHIPSFEGLSADEGCEEIVNQLGLYIKEDEKLNEGMTLHIEEHNIEGDIVFVTYLLGAEEELEDFKVEKKVREAIE